MDWKEVIELTIGMARIRALAQPVEKGGLGLTIDQLRQSMVQYERSVADEVASAYDWDFALKKATTTTTTAADYTFTGNDADVLTITRVYYDNDRLGKMTISALDDLLSRSAISSVLYWTPAYRNDEGEQVVTLTGTPETGKTLDYWYIRKDVDIAEFPSVMSYTLQMALAKRVDGRFAKDYEDAKARAIASYERGITGVDIAVIDSDITAKNVARAKLHGWS